MFYRTDFYFMPRMYVYSGVKPPQNRFIPTRQYAAPSAGVAELEVRAVPSAGVAEREARAARAVSASAVVGVAFLRRPSLDLP